MENKDLEVKHRECRFVTHLPRNKTRPDTHIVKEALTLEDGSIVPNLRLITDYQRPFYLTKEAYRNHEQKKELEQVGKLEKFNTNQSDLAKAINLRLNNSHANTYYGRLTSSPYLYGSDVTSTSLIKNTYNVNAEKKGIAGSPYSFATFDLETDIDDGHILINNTCVKVNDTKIVELGILAHFLRNIENPKEKLKIALDKYLGDKIKNIDCKIIMEIYDDEYDCIVKPLRRVHENNPDFLTSWNINFDVPRIAERCEALGKDVAMVWKDPSLPDNMAYYKYLEGQYKMVSDSNVVHSFSPHQQWHSFETSASFTLICSMTSYYQLRVHKPEEPEYNLNYVMNNIIGERKLNFKQADGYHKGEWHSFMQKNYPIEYCIYAVWDSLGLYQLQEELQDLAVSLPISMDHSDFKFVKKRSKRNDDNVHFLNIPNRISGTLGVTASEEAETEKVQSVKKWIVTVPAYKQIGGLKCIKEYPNMSTGMRALVYYLDITSAYPSATILNNVSKSTTQREVCRVVGSPSYPDAFKFNYMNDLAGNVNSMRFCKEIYNFPPADSVLESIAGDLGIDL